MLTVTYIHAIEKNHTEWKHYQKVLTLNKNEALS